MTIYVMCSYCSVCLFQPDIILELSSLGEELPVMLEESLLLQEYGEFDNIGVTNSHMGRSGRPDMQIINAFSGF